MRVYAHFAGGAWRAHLYYMDQPVLVSVPCLDFTHAREVGWALVVDYFTSWGVQAG